MHLSYIDKWNCLKKWSLQGCNIGVIGINYLQRNRLLRTRFETGGLTQAKHIIASTETKLFRKTKRNYSRNFLTSSSTEPLQSIDFGNETYTSSDRFSIRGGETLETFDANNKYKDLFDKLEQYKEKILTNEVDELELSFYIQTLIKSDDYSYLEVSKKNVEEENDGHFILK